MLHHASYTKLEVDGRATGLAASRRATGPRQAQSPRTHQRGSRKLIPVRRSIGVAYFSMEFGLSEALPIYSGGLGNVAGDQLKAGSDLGVPIVGVGLLYQQGYFRQAIDHDRAISAICFPTIRLRGCR